jgi:hypothetical protein
MDRDGMNLMTSKFYQLYINMFAETYRPVTSTYESSCLTYWTVISFIYVSPFGVGIGAILVTGLFTHRMDQSSPKCIEWDSS